jgi:hypothetical protein
MATFALHLGLLGLSGNARSYSFGRLPYFLGAAVVQNHVTKACFSSSGIAKADANSNK